MTNQKNSRRQLFDPNLNVNEGDSDYPVDNRRKCYNFISKVLEEDKENSLKNGYVHGRYSRYQEVNDTVCLKCINNF